MNLSPLATLFLIFIMFTLAIGLWARLSEK